MSSLDSTFGALLVGLVVGSVLFGLTSLQTYIYYKRFPNDNRWLRYLVGGIWILDLLHVVFCTHTMYYYLVSGFGNRRRLEFEIWSFALQTDFNGLIGMAVELFFARRVYKLSRNAFLSSFIAMLAIIHFVLGIYFTYEAFVLGRFVLFGDLIWVTTVGLGSAAVADIVIAVSMVVLLRRVRTGVQKTDDLIATLIKFAINTGAVTSIVATLCVILFALMPTNFIWTSFFWILGKLYANSLLANLNERTTFNSRINSNQETVVLPDSGTSHKLVGDIVIKTVTPEELEAQYPSSARRMSFHSRRSIPPTPPPSSEKPRAVRYSHYGSDSDSYLNFI